MPPQNRLAPPLQNSLAYSVPIPLEPGMRLPEPAPRFVPRRELENLSIGLGRGAVTGMESLEQLLTQPVATAQALIEAARQLGTDPRIVLDMLRAARQKAMSGSLGLGELIGENVTPSVKGRAPKMRIDASRKVPEPVFGSTSIGQGSELFESDVLAPARQALFQGNSRVVTLKDGTKAHLVRFGDQDNAEGRLIAFDEKGKFLGEMDFAIKGPYLQEDKFTPNIFINKEAQRKGLGTAMYDLAAELNASIPPAESTSSVRTEAGAAFRKAWRKK